MVYKSRYIALLVLIAILLLISTDASAAIDNHGVLDSILDQFKSSAKTWGNTFFDAASWLFWLLVAISMIWTFGFMALHQADLMEFFAELMRFAIFTGFFWWLLENGPDFALSIVKSLTILGANASGVGANESFTPSKIIDVGFVIFGQTLAEGSWFTSPIDSFICAVAGFGILFVCALIAINVLMLMITAWVLAYSGVFILGFGGSRWTSEIAITYYKHLLGIALQIMVMILLVGVGWSIINDTMSKISAGLEIAEMGVLFVVCLCVYVLANKIPPLVAGIVTGPTGGPPIGAYGGMAAASAAWAGVGLAAGGASAIGSGAMAIGRGASSLIDRIRSGGEDAADSGSDLFGGMDFTDNEFGGTTDSGYQQEDNGPSAYSQAAGHHND